MPMARPRHPLPRTRLPCKRSARTTGGRPSNSNVATISWKPPGNWPSPTSSQPSSRSNAGPGRNCTKLNLSRTTTTTTTTPTTPHRATRTILGSRGIALTQCDEPHELVTPTGAALLAECAEAFGRMQGLVASKIGYSLGTRDNKTRPNVLRAVLGESSTANTATHDWE